MKKPARCLSILGTGSDVGKSIVVTALCRIFNSHGIRIAPFKAQNMSNNSYVTIEGGEIGRAQVVQAEAARLEPDVDMNPVLLKPSTDTGAQVVLRGKPHINQEAHQYFSDTTYLSSEAKVSLQKLREEYDYVIMEGAGSCAEVNLRDRDYVNFEMAHTADAEVILVADIDRGGVFAQIIGTLNVISDEDRRRIKGIIINRFRGDPNLFKNGIAWIEEKTKLPVLGLIPFFRHIDIDSEDALPLDVQLDPKTPLDKSKINMAVIRLPHISNFTDFSRLQSEPIVNIHYLSKPMPLNGYDFVFLPGTKNVRFDLDWLREQTWDKHLKDYVQKKGRLGGICGGYQMLGKIVFDPHGIEGEKGRTAGLDFLDLETTLNKEKILTRSKGTWNGSGVDIDGYEIHMGQTKRGSDVQPAIRITERDRKPAQSLDGAKSRNECIWGTYFHGLFDSSTFRHQFLTSFGKSLGSISKSSHMLTSSDYKDKQYDLLADHFLKHLDMNQLEKILGLQY